MKVRDWPDRQRAGWQRLEGRVIDRRSYGERNYQNDHGPYNEAPHAEGLYRAEPSFYELAPLFRGANAKLSEVRMAARPFSAAVWVGESRARDKVNNASQQRVCVRRFGEAH